MVESGLRGRREYQIATLSRFAHIAEGERGEQDGAVKVYGDGAESVFR